MGALSKIVGLEVAKAFCSQLATQNINYKCCIKHPEVVSCEESKYYYKRYQEYLEEEYAIVKHLFLQERKGQKRKFLILLEAEKKVDLRLLKETLECGKLEFVNNKELNNILNTVSGNISLFHLSYDRNNQIHLVLEEELLSKKLLAFHPLYNGMSIFISPKDTLHYLATIKRSFTTCHLPSKQEQTIVEKKYNMIY